jgi:O-antigen/teichoic acid export membrane protein
VAAVILISLHFGLAGYLAAQVASAGVVLILMTLSVWRRMPPQARTVPGIGHIEKKVVAFSATAFGIAAVHFVLGQADKVALGYYLNARQVGVYAISMALVGFVPIALQSVNQIFAPTIAELHAAGNYVLLQRLYASLTKWVLIITIPLALTVAVFSKGLMTVFGSGFEAGAWVLAVGTIGQLFDCGVGSVGFLLLMSGNQVTLMKIQTANAVLMIILSIVLVPRLGILGAALASSITVAGTNLWGLVEVRQKLKLFPYDRTYVKLIWPAIATAAVLLAERHIFSRMSWREAGIALVCAYAGFFGGMLLLGLESEDRMLARLAWQKLRNLS